ncbi:helix-turn-helix domain-containing protein [Quadrisphaera oryzae]|uniref:helix-turn-helix domain-containing protein n=1 Tax=Quadrisphaera TaxID=317661 RepID=UPI001645460A|nr:helix-turn-helix transcriptional regulator [Quadrisphaera sp. RL12-1S]MBC3760602.1 helix-turn-helix transcriptional regulator [Quadrisphaera sp. RL12-1S]
MPTVADLLPLPDDGAVGRRVRMARRVRDLSQDDVARRLGSYGLQLHHTAIGHVERGTRALKFREAVALARVLDVPLRWIAGEGSATDPGEPVAQTEAMRVLDDLLKAERERALAREAGGE